MCAAPSENARGLRHRYVSLQLAAKKNKVDAAGDVAAGGRRWSMAHCVPMPNAGVRCARARWARDARCPHASELKQSLIQVITTEMCTLGWVKEARVPESDVVLFP